MLYENETNQISEGILTNHYMDKNEVYKVRTAVFSTDISKTQNDDELMEFCAPGRIEICGNHTDHQHGLVLTASIDLFCRATVKLNKNSVIQIESDGFEPFCVSVDDFDFCENERFTSKALVKGILRKFREKGNVPGFDAYIVSDVMIGSGLSSSAAFEILVCRIINTLGRFHLSDEELAAIAQYSENVYYGKPCGMMDQLASSCMGLLYIDFADPEAPFIERLDFNFNQYGYDIVLVDSHVNHANLTEDYAAIPEEISKVCSHFGKNYLREVAESEFNKEYEELQKEYSERSLLRCLHVYDENKRVQKAREAVKQGSILSILKIINESGNSSVEKLQNITPLGINKDEGLAAVIKICKEALQGEGAVRVHGGGFAGTVLCVVPRKKLGVFSERINCVLGADSVKNVNISTRYMNRRI